MLASKRKIIVTTLKERPRKLRNLSERCCYLKFAEIFKNVNINSLHKWHFIVHEIEEEKVPIEVPNGEGKPEGEEESVDTEVKA
jgi:hypothetical protein